ncbi:MAG: AAA family ATPase [Deltaproteobacteria bacterium]|nr:AAA family ATPase [Deltaproteobacteria bacterium]
MDLPWLIKALLDTESYPERPAEVKLRQTHISYLFFTPAFVYKIKKPVNFGFLDFTALEQRLFFCGEEIRLNRRLAPSIYLDVVKVVSKDGRVLMEGEGEAIEYAVKMKRLPDESMLESALKKGTVRENILERIAGALASFHKTAETNEYIKGFGSPEAIGKNTAENFSQTSGYIGNTISKDRFEGIKRYTEDFLKAHGSLFQKRAADGFIRDCHGDIHSEHISIADGINIFDCIEFNERFRFSDIVADMAFLSMDLDYHNRHDLSRVFDEAYFRASNDGDGVRLIDFYRCYRAYVRGKVEGFKSAEAEVSEEDKRAARLNAVYHFYLAGLYASSGFKPMMLLIRGLSGTGKSALARRVSDIIWLNHLSTDIIRKELAGISPFERRRAPFGEDIYREEFTERTYKELLKRGSALLQSGRSVVLDATFSKERYIKEAKAEAKRVGADFKIIECIADDGAVRRRFLEREKECGKEGFPLSDAGWEIYLRQKETFERTGEPRVIIDSGKSLEENIAILFWKIFG